MPVAIHPTAMENTTLASSIVPSAAGAAPAQSLRWQQALHPQECVEPRPKSSPDAIARSDSGDSSAHYCRAYLKRHLRSRVFAVGHISARLPFPFFEILSFFHPKRSVRRDLGVPRISVTPPALPETFSFVSILPCSKLIVPVGVYPALVKYR